MVQVIQRQGQFQPFVQAFLLGLQQAREQRRLREEEERRRKQQEFLNQLAKERLSLEKKRIALEEQRLKASQLADEALRQLREQQEPFRNLSNVLSIAQTLGLQPTREAALSLLGSALTPAQRQALGLPTREQIETGEGILFPEPTAKQPMRGLAELFQPALVPEQAQMKVSPQELTKNQLAQLNLRLIQAAQRLTENQVGVLGADNRDEFMRQFRENLRFLREQIGLSPSELQPSNTQQTKPGLFPANVLSQTIGNKDFSPILEKIPPAIRKQFASDNQLISLLKYQIAAFIQTFGRNPTEQEILDIFLKATREAMESQLKSQNLPPLVDFLGRQELKTPAEQARELIPFIEGLGK